MNKWDERFIKLAEEVSTWSKDPSKKIGVVAVDPNTKDILSQGYNGFPRGVYDEEERYLDKELKYKLVVHGEMNCIFNAVNNGVSLKGSYLYVYGLPVCNECAKGIIQSGISKVYMKFSEDSKSEKWLESFKITKMMFNESGVKYEFIE